MLCRPAFRDHLRIGRCRWTGAVCCLLLLLPAGDWRVLAMAPLLAQSSNEESKPQAEDPSSPSESVTGFRTVHRRLSQALERKPHLSPSHLLGDGHARRFAGASAVPASLLTEHHGRNGLGGPLRC
jgi:hypothetical protein